MKTRKEKIEAIIEILKEAKDIRTECTSNLITVYAHMIKCVYQPERHTDSWDKSIIQSRDNILVHMDKSLYSHLESKMSDVIKKSVKEALSEMNQYIKAKADKIKIPESEKDKFFTEWDLDKVLSDEFLKDFFDSIPESNNIYYRKVYIKNIKEYLKL